ncbi:hypothetical protein PAMP_003537 [Pampus punctatissimus]
MRLCVWAGAWSLLLTLVLLTPLHIKADTFQPRERHYYIAAVEIDWNYSGSDTHGLGPTYKKVVFREYEEDFRQAKTHPSWLGANYFDNTSQKEKEDDVVWPHSKHVYYWEVTSDVSPQPNDPNCLTYTYVSHQNVVEDYNSGLIGALLICKPGSLNESGEQADIHQELVFLFGVFDEKESKYKQHEPASDSHVKYTINGYTKGSLPGMSSQPEVFSVHVNGQVLQQMGHKVSSVGLISGSTSTASMVALHTGRWLLSSHIVKHMEAGMHGFVDVKKCDAFRAPRRRMTIAQKRESREWIYYIAAEEIVWDYAPKMHEHIDEDYKFQYLKQSSTRIGGRYKKAVYTLYKNESFTERSENKQRKNELGILGPVIRAQIRDVIKLKADKEQHAVFTVFDENKSWYLDENIRQFSDRSKVNKADIDFYKYNVMHNEMTNIHVLTAINGYAFESGPCLGFCNGEVATWHVSSIGAQDYIQTATFYGHPFELNSRTEDFLSLYPMTGETIAMNMDNIGVWLLASLNSHGTTKGMRLRFQDVECFRDYEFEYNYEEEDPFRQWKPPSLDDIKTEEEKPKRKEEIPEEIDDYTLMFADELGLRSRKNQSTSSDADILDLSFLKDYDVLPEDTDIITLNFSSTTNETKSKNETFIPKPNPVNETLLSNMKELDGVNLTAVNLLNQSQFEYNYEDEDPFKQWKPPSLDDIKTEEEKPKRKEEIPEEIDDYTLMFADELGLRSLKNQSTSSDADILDLSVLKYDDVLPEDTDIITLNFSSTTNETKSKNKTFIPKPNPVNETLLSNIKELDGVNLTAVNLLNQSQFEYNYEDEDPFRQWKPPSLDDIKTEEEKPKRKEEIPEVIDDYTLMFADELGLRSRKNQSTSSDADILDLSVLKYDDVLPEDTDIITLNFSPTNNETKSKNETFIPKPNPVNETLLSNMKELDGVNLTAVNLLNQSIENAASFSDNSSVSKIGNTTSPDVFLKNDNITLNSSAPPFGNHDNVTASETENSTLDDMASLMVGNVSTDMTDRNVTLPGNLTSISEAERVNETQSGDNETSVDTNSMEESEESLTRGDVFFYSVPLSPSRTNDLNSTTERNVPSPSTSTKKENVNDTATNHVTMSDGTNHSMSVPMPNVRELNISSVDGHNVTIFELEVESRGNLSLSSHSFTESSSEELSASSEEVYIYLQANNTEVIKTTSLKTQDHNWTYEGTPQTVPMEMPDHMSKYLGKVTPVPKRKPKIRKMNYRHRPMKGQGMKTKKKKEYKPQVKTSLPFSPRGFNPGMTPRGSRPNSSQYLFDQEELINLPVVIGVSRPDFSDYELYVPGNEPDHLGRDEQDVSANEYEYVSYKDPYSSHEDIKNLNLYEDAKDPRRLGAKTYFISAEEVEWDYAGYGQRRENKFGKNSRETKFIKVVFRSYIDGHFRTPDIRGEMDEHLGILGPVIKAEVGQTIMVVFRNNANRPYSLHPNGVSYTKYTEGLSYEDGSKYWHKYDNEVQPNTTFTYIWKVNPTVGPMTDESQCRTWAYYSGVNPERDIHSGLIGPLLVCRKGTLDNKVTNTREFTLLFMTFDESQSWYYEMNHKMMQRKNRRRILDLKENLKFHSINGIIYNLKGLRMYTNQLVRWHLINMGSPRDFQSVHFHGQTFLHKKISNYRHAIYPLLPGSFATLEMYPSKPGLWQLETEVGFNQQQGMQTLFLVIDNDCYRTLGLESGSVKDKQIRASNTRGYWMPHFARLNNQGKYNAWSTEQNNSWIEVDFQRPVVISQVATQGAKQLFHSQYVLKYSISYSNDRWKWIFYKGDSIHIRKVFAGNEDAYATKTNTFFPPMIGRYIRLHPITWYNTATVRMEFYGCELDGCSVPLGMESGLIKDSHITASSTANSWYSGTWKPSLARLNRQGTVNAWQAKFNDMNQWLQVELPQIKKITGIITQGAKSLGREMYVKSYTLVYSDDGIRWKQYTDVDDVTFKTFIGNTDNNEHVKNYIHPPIFSRFIRIIPQSWKGTITMRIELLGCDFE